MSNQIENQSVVLSITDKLAQIPTTSAKIRFLNQQGFQRSSIALILGIRYQWVRNVLITPLKKI